MALYPGADLLLFLLEKLFILAKYGLSVFLWAGGKAKTLLIARIFS